MQLALTLALTRVLSKLFSYLDQPVVIGEVVAGILMGPSVLGHIPGELRAGFRWRLHLNRGHMDCMFVHSEMQQYVVPADSSRQDVPDLLFCDMKSCLRQDGFVNAIAAFYFLR